VEDDPILFPGLCASAPYRNEAVATFYVLETVVAVAELGLDMRLVIKPSRRGAGPANQEPKRQRRILGALDIAR